MDIQALLGHESIATTQIDTHFGQDRMEQVWGGCDALVGERQCLTSG